MSLDAWYAACESFYEWAAALRELYPEVGGGARVRTPDEQRELVRLRSMRPIELQAFDADRKRQAKQIDPDRCEMMYTFAWYEDPYALGPPYLEADTYDKETFCRNPGDQYWVFLDDVPEAIRERIKALSDRKVWF
jgi:hypothetical protein